MTHIKSQLNKHSSCAELLYVPDLLSSDLREAHEEFIRNAEQSLKQAGIESADEYLTRVQSESFSKDKERLKDIPLQAFTRTFPSNSQSVSFLSLNPRLNEEPGNVPSKTLRKLASTAGNLNSFTQSCAIDYADTYFADTNGYHHLVGILREYELLPHPEDGHKQYFQAGSVPDVYDDIYFSTGYKMATPEEKDMSKLPEEITELSVRCMLRELESINPKVVFSFGNKTHEWIDRFVAKPITPDAPDIKSANGKDIHSHAYQLDFADDPIAICVGHQSRPRGGWYQFRKNKNHPQVRNTIEYLLNNTKLGST